MIACLPEEDINGIINECCIVDNELAKYFHDTNPVLALDTDQDGVPIKYEQYSNAIQSFKNESLRKLVTEILEERDV